MKKNKYEVCQKASDGKWESVAECPNYSRASKVFSALKLLDGKEYSIYKDGVKFRNI